MNDLLVQMQLLETIFLGVLGCSILWIDYCFVICLYGCPRDGIVHIPWIDGVDSGYKLFVLTMIFIVQKELGALINAFLCYVFSLLHVSFGDCAP
jgi:hypothetical protein